jgi:hypothetical protein
VGRYVEGSSNVGLIAVGYLVIDLVGVRMPEKLVGNLVGKERGHVVILVRSHAMLHHHVERITRAKVRG